jgi:hypothetical protein
MNLPIILAKAGAPPAGAALGVNDFRLPWTAAACLLAASLLWAARH